MPKRTSNYHSALLEDLKDLNEAENYLNAALQDSEETFLIALRDVAEARQMAKIAENAGVSRESLYRMLSSSGNPTYRSLIGILGALGVEFSRVRTRPLETEPLPEFTPFVPPGPSGIRMAETRAQPKRSKKQREHIIRHRIAIKALTENPEQYAPAA